MDNKNFGYVAQYESPKELLKAAKAIHKEGYKVFDTHSPFPIHGMDDAMGLGHSKLSWISLIGGAIGLTTGLTLQLWASGIAYPLTISGKPYFSFQAFIPVTFELMILFTAFATVFGMFAINKLPTFFHHVFNHSNFDLATSHGFFVSIEATDTKFDEEKTKLLLENTGAKNIELIKEVV